MRSLLQATLRRNVSPIILQQRCFSTRLASVAIANKSSNQWHSSDGSQRLQPLAWLMLSSSVLVAKTSRCDEEESEEEEDPYDNLPEEDEPTHCSICLTYRQGPCRPYWRKVEACTKDNEPKGDRDNEGDDKNDDEEKKEKEDSSSVDEDDDDRDPPCLKYMLPWIDCASGFRNLYNLIELDTNYTEGIADLEKDATQNVCWAPSNTPPVDWSAWKQYLEQNKDWTLPKQDSVPTAKTSLWKTLDQSKDPELIEVLATVDVVQDDGILECAYAQDQDGNVIGFQYGTKPSDASKAREDKEEKKESTVTLKIRILPSRTQTVTISAAYTQPEKEESQQNEESADKKKDSLESHIFKSKPFSLDKV